MEKENRPTLTVVYAATALKQLDDIWAWNEEHYGADHANRYVEFLERQIDALGADHRRGKRLGIRPEMSFILIRRKSKGHGHVVVYTVGERQINVLHVFHTAQDWQMKLTEETTRE